VRVASKSVRVRAVLQHALGLPGFRGLMCFTAGEAAFLAARGFDDLLVAYPTVEPSELRALCAAVRAGTRAMVMVDEPEHVQRLAAIAADEGVELPLCLDVDMSLPVPGLWFGVRRSPVREVAQALAVLAACERHGHVRLAGVMGYEAQVAGLPDAVPGRGPTNVVIRLLKRRSIPEFMGRRAAIVQALRERGAPLELVNGGGTGSLEITRTDPSVTELTAGSGLFAPALFDGFERFRLRPAAGFALPIVRRPTAGIVTCHGGGYIASGAAGRDKLPLPLWPEGARLLDQEGAGEVQTPVRYSGPIALGLGDPVVFRHAKAGELCERFDRMLLLRGGAVVDEVPTYRGDGQTFV
jgi:D-serine deaminase-like pyridoxal phosphate-dependent protein